IGAAVRGGGGRHSDPHRPLARAGRVLPGRQRGLGNRPNSGRGGGAHHAFTTGRREHRRRRPGEGAGTPHLHPKGGGAGELPSSRPPFSPNVRKVVLIPSRTCLRAISGGRIWKVITPELGFRHSISAEGNVVACASWFDSRVLSVGVLRLGNRPAKHLCDSRICD